MAALFLVALAARARFVGAPPYGDEAIHYELARNLWHYPSSVRFFYDELPLSNVLFWGRPMFFLVLAPGAALGFEGFRIEHSILAATLPVLVALVVGKACGRLGPALFAGAIVALDPSLIMWSVRVFPDTMAAIG